MTCPHRHHHGESANARQRETELLLTGAFLVVEVVYGFLPGSLAPLSGAGLAFSPGRTGGHASRSRCGQPPC